MTKTVYRVSYRCQPLGYVEAASSADALRKVREINHDLNPAKFTVLPTIAPRADWVGQWPA